MKVVRSHNGQRLSPASAPTPNMDSTRVPRRTLSRRQFFGRMGALTAGTVSLGAADLSRIVLTASTPPLVGAFDAEVPTAWFDLSLNLVRETAGYSPPVASRSFGYTGVTLYEALVPGMPDHRSLEGQLSGLSGLPQAGKNDVYHWPTVANSGLAEILRSLFPTASSTNLAAIEALEEGFADELRPTLPPGVFNRSVDRGRAVANAVFDWSTSDGGHEGYLNNFPPYDPPVGPGLWVPTPPGFLPALQPFWGSNRTFALASGADCSPGPHKPYSEDKRSQFFAEAKEVYDTVNKLTPEQETIALYWSDDPGNTATPPGHSVSILTQILRNLDSGLDVAAEAYAKVGMAVADAFISCWHVKYVFNLLRPVTYIQRLINKKWLPLLITPPFPEHTSGHSTQSGAWAQVMTDLFGEMAFTDHTHDARGFEPRSFNSFFEAAEEAAVSRLYGGIHFRTANELGLLGGQCVGEAVSAMQFAS